MNNFRSIALASAAVLVLACGGNVVFEGAAGGGGEGAGAAGSTTTKSGSTTKGVSATSVSTGAATPCELWCAEVPEVCWGDECMQLCASMYVPGCEAQTDALLLCGAANLPPETCTLPEDLCRAEVAAYSQCVDPGGCGPSSCAFEECWCSATCSGGTLVADCDSFGPTSCDCYFNDAYIGSCMGDTCDVQASCCSDLLGVPPP